MTKASASKFSTVIPTFGSAGNVFAIIGTAMRLLREIGVPEDEREDLRARALAAPSYSEACAVVREWFPLEGDKRL